MLRASGQSFLSHPNLRALYPEYLCASHGVVRASVPLMKAAAHRARTLDDGVAGPLRRYLEQHITEELDHDRWLLEDLELLGVERSSVLARPPSPPVAALVGAQYYWVLHFHPIALLGYMVVLEGYPPSPAQIRVLMERTGLPRPAFRTLLEHAEVDPEHGDEVFRFLDELSLSEELSTVLGLSMMHTATALAAVIDDIVDGGARAADRREESMG